ncbi:MAG: hypothetical protein JOY51_00850 [Nevskia sp.]|nr:hypothetical protein [Nevskia sp.]
MLLGIVLLPPSLPAADAPQAPACSKAASASYVKLPAPALACDANGSGRLACSVDKSEASCAAAGPAYARVLKRLLRPAWWSTPAEELEACREQKEGASPDEGAGEAIQGSERVRLLVLGNGCDNSAGVYDVALAVKSDRGVAVRMLELDYYEPRQEAPFSLALARNGADTLALFTRYTHDLHEAAIITRAYKVDLASGDVAEYPLYLTPAGARSELSSTEPTLNFSEDESSAQVQGDKLSDGFVQYSYLADCPEDGDCVAENVVEKRRFSWNGSAFVVDHYNDARHIYLRKLAAHRECLKAKFDPKTGEASCPDEDLDDGCERDNDLSYLNYQAGNAGRAGQYAAHALEECRFDPKELAAARFNDRQARGK